LAPLGYALVKEYTAEQTGSGAPPAGFGAQGQPDCPIGRAGGLKGILHIAVEANDRATVDAFYHAALAAKGQRRARTAAAVVEAVCHRP
jgi:hypothetical protein